MKIRKPLRFEIPLTRIVIDLSRPNGKKVINMGCLYVVGEATHYPGDQDDPYHVDYEKILLNGADIMAMFESDQFEQTREYIMDAVMAHCQFLFRPEPDNEPHSFFEEVADVVRKHNKIMYGI